MLDLIGLSSIFAWSRPHQNSHQSAFVAALALTECSAQQPNVIVCQL
jgi:hypothetical protein